jgi:hypothetical protein
MSNRSRSHQIAPDAAEYVDAWARDILAAVGKRDVRRLLADYKALADNKRLPKSDRNTAAERAKALEELL